MAARSSGIKTPAFKQELSYLMPNEDVRGIGAPYATEVDFATASKPFDMDKFPGSGVVVTQLPNPIYGKFIRIPEGSAATPGLAFATVDDDDSGIYLSAVNTVGMSVNGTANMTWSSTVIRQLSTRVDITGQLRIGTSTATAVAGEFSATSAGGSCAFISGTLYADAGPIEVRNGATVRVRLGTSTSYFTSSAGDNILAVGPVAAGYYVHISRESNATPGENPEICLDGAGIYAIPFVFGIRSRGTYALPTTVIDGDGLLEFDGRGYDGTAYSGPRVDISMEAAATWAVGDHPTRIVFATTPAGSTTIADRWKIQPDGTLLAGGNNTIDIGDSAATGKPKNIYFGTQALGPDGSSTNPTYSFASVTNSGFYGTSSGNLIFSKSGSIRMGILAASTQLLSTQSLSWSTVITGTSDVFLERNAAGILDLHRTTVGSSQFSIHNTRTDTSNYERLEFFWSSNVAIMRTMAAGTGTVRALHLRHGGSTSIGVLIGVNISNGIDINGGSAVSTSNTSAQLARVGSSVTLTANSGTHGILDLMASMVPSASSTADLSSLRISTTINYASGGAGRVQLIRLTPTNTALPTGLNAAIVLSSTANALGGIHFHNQTDETTNYEVAKLWFTSNVFTISTGIAGTGTARNIQITSAALLGLQGAASSGIVLNDSGADADTRIEGDTLPYMIFCDASDATENIAFLATGAPNWQSMDRGFYVENVTTAPSGNPASGFFHYSSGGQPTWRDDGGVIYSLTQATGGENVTNNVTDTASTAGTIPDITNGAVYATDYTNLRNALFQIARMLKQDHDQLRAMGILT